MYQRPKLQLLTCVQSLVFLEKVFGGERLFADVTFPLFNLVHLKVLIQVSLFLELLVADAAGKAALSHRLR